MNMLFNAPFFADPAHLQLPFFYRIYLSAGMLMARRRIVEP